MKRKLFGLFLLLVCFGLVGCGGSDEKASDSSEKKETIEITDVLDRKVKIEGPVEKVYYGFYYENLLSVGGPDVFTKVKATSIYDTEGYFLSLSKMYRKNVPGYKDMVDVGSTIQDNFNAEKLLELELDVMIVGNYQYEALGDNINVIEDAGIPIVVIDYTKGTMELQCQSTEILGKIFGTEDRAEKLIANYKENYKDIENRLKDVKDKKTIFSESHSTVTNYKDLGASGLDSDFSGSYLKKAMGDNIMTAFNEKSSSTRIDPEYLLERDPDVLVFIAGESSRKNKKDGVIMGQNVTEEEVVASAKGILAARPGWSDLQAVKNDQIYVVDNSICRTMEDYVIVQYYAKAMYPDLMKDVDPLKNYEAFYEEFLPDLPCKGTFFYQLKGTDME